MSRPADWTQAYARQSRADFDAWNALAEHKELAPSQRLHFLQMACEKLCKAHLCKGGAEPTILAGSHAYIAGTLPVIVRQQFALLTGKRSRAGLMKHVKHLSREIELLAPAVDDGGRRPDNCEYPWEDHTGQLHVPAEHSFPALRLLTAPAGRTFLKTVRAAMEALV